jgi:hypothetical protein
VHNYPSYTALPAPLTLLEVLFLKEHDVIVADPTNRPEPPERPDVDCTTHLLIKKERGGGVVSKSREEQHQADHPQRSKCTATLNTLPLPAPLTLLAVLFLKVHTISSR